MTNLGVAGGLILLQSFGAGRWAAFLTSITCFSVSGADVLALCTYAEISQAVQYSAVA